MSNVANQDPFEAVRARRVVLTSDARVCADTLCGSFCSGIAATHREVISRD